MRCSFHILWISPVEKSEQLGITSPRPGYFAAREKSGKSVCAGKDIC